jgi:CBS domain-containing protein
MRLARESSMLMLEEVTAMKVEDVMTRDVITVAPQSALKAAAQTLAANRISGVPVVEDGRVLGVVSEADILEKEAAESKPSVLGRLLRRDRAGAKKAARTAGEAMTSPAVTVPPQRDVAHAARRMVDRGINRLPVVTDDHGLVGIVTRADLVRAFVRSDQEIARELREDVVVGTLWMNAEETLAGEVEQKAHAELLERLAARVPGVVSMRSELRWRIDQPKLPQSDPRVPQPPRHR